MSSKEVLSYDIGIEIEGFIKPKTPVPKDSSLEEVASLVASTFNNSLPQGQRQLAKNWGSHAGHYPDDPTHKNKWIVSDDLSLPQGETKNRWALEFISMIYRFEQNSKWRSEVIDFWKQLWKIGQLSTSNSCSTQVHISPKGKGNFWSLGQLKQVAQAVVYFEQAFEAIMPPSRCNNSHVFRNKANNRILKDLEFKECCERIQKCDDVVRLVLLMQPQTHPTLEGKEDDPRKSSAWNFKNTRNGKGEIGTIEFRCAPGVLSGEHCLVWVEVAVSFVQAAAQYGSEDNLNNFASDVAGLLKFIRGASVEGMNKPELLSVVFDGCKGKVEEIAAEPATPTEEGEDLDMEIRAKVDGRIGALPKSLFT